MTMERPVRRSELRLSSTTPERQDDQNEAIQRFRALAPLEFDIKDVPMVDGDIELRHDANEEVAFRLFAPSKAIAKPVEAETVRKVSLHSPSVDFSKAGFVHAREDSHYFTGSADETTLHEYELSALSTEDVLDLSRTPWPGSACPWKVSHIKPGQVSKAARAFDHEHYSSHPMSQRVETSLPSEDPERRKRPGKQARIKSRIRAAKVKAEAEAQLKAEEADKDKKTQRNREKKAKKKVREKAKKAAARAGDEQVAGVSASESDDDDGE